MTAPRWEVEVAVGPVNTGEPSRLVFGRKLPLAGASRWCDELIIRSPQHSRGQAYLGPEGFDALAELVDRATVPTTMVRDSLILDRIAELLRAEEWPGASGMEDIAELVREVRDLTPDPDVHWSRH